MHESPPSMLRVVGSSPSVRSALYACAWHHRQSSGPHAMSHLTRPRLAHSLGWVNSSRYTSTQQIKPKTEFFAKFNITLSIIHLQKNTKCSRLAAELLKLFYLRSIYFISYIIMYYRSPFLFFRNKIDARFTADLLLGCSELSDQLSWGLVGVRLLRASVAS